MVSSLLDRRQRNNPVPVYLVLTAGQALCFSLFFTVQLIYQVTLVGLNPLQMVLVGTVLEITCVLFEIPTGIFADVYSRRLSILIGIVLMGCSYLLEGAIPAFWAAMLSQVFWGIGGTFNSGANQAWITDEIGEDAVGPVFLRGRQMWLIGGLAGTLACVVLGIINIQLPMILAGSDLLQECGRVRGQREHRDQRAQHHRDEDLDDREPCGEEEVQHQGADDEVEGIRDRLVARELLARSSGPRSGLYEQRHALENEKGDEYERDDFQSRHGLDSLLRVVQRLSRGTDH